MTHLHQKLVSVLAAITLATSLTPAAAFAATANSYPLASAAMTAAEGEAASNAAADERFSATVDFEVRQNKNSNGTTEVIWDDSWFNTSSYTYNHELATTAAVLAASEYLTAEDVQKDLTNLRFETDAQYIVKPGDSEALKNFDTIGCSIASRKIAGSGETIVLVDIRGTGPDLEWHGNLNVSNTSQKPELYHEGFEIAAKTVKSALAQYLEAHDINLADSYLLVTGHSRGGAVANILGAWAGDNECGAIARDRVYTYTFESPTTTTRSDAGDNRYANIFNIVNPEDIVSYLPLPEWGYGHFGINLCLPSKGSNTSAENYLDLYDNMNAVFREYCSDENGNPVDFENYQNGRSAVISSTQALMSLTDCVQAVYTKRYGNYTLHRTLTAAINTLAGRTSIADTIVLTSALSTPEYYNLVESVLGAQFANSIKEGTATISPASMHAHTPESSVAWMQSAQASLGEYPSIFRESFCALKIEGPVDVAVYGADGRLLAQVKDGAVDESLIENGVSTTAVNGGQFIDLPKGESYRVELTGTASGDLDLTAQTTGGVDARSESSKTYSGIPLNAGKGFIFTVGEDALAESTTLVAKKANPIKLSAQKLMLKAASVKEKKQTVKRDQAFAVANAQGDVTFSVTKYSSNEAKQQIKVKTSGKVIVKKGTPKGTYKLKVKAAASGNGDYNPGSSSAMLVVKVK